MTVTPTAKSKLRVPLASDLAALVQTAFTTNANGLMDTLAALVGNARDVSQLEDGSWPTITRNDRLSYRWIARHDPSRRPTSENGALPGDQIVTSADSGFLGGTTITTPETRSAALVETFAGALSGDAWPLSRWVKGLSSGAGSVTVESEAGVLVSGATGGYASGDAVRVASVATWDDVEIVCDVILDVEADSGVNIIARSDQADLNLANGVGVFVYRGGLRLAHAVEWAFTTAVDLTRDYTAGVTYRVRVILAGQQGGGTLARARVWPAANPEPDTWDIDQTLTGTLPATGHLGFSAPGLAEAAVNTVTVDNVSVYTQPPGSDSGWWGAWAG